MKITFVIPQDGLSGGIRVVSIYAEHLQRRGHHITVVAAPPPRPSLKQRIKRLLQFSHNSIFNSTIVASTPQGSYFDALDIHFHTLDQYRPVTDRDLPDADVVIATWWETAEWIAPLAPQKGSKVYFIQGYEAFDYFSKARVEATYSLPYSKITISQWLFALMQNHHAASKQTFLVPNGVNLEQFQSPARMRSKSPTVGLVYSTTPCKGCDIALEAFTEARKHVKDLRLVAFGMEHPTPLLPLPEGTQYCVRPSQDSLRERYAQCDVWLVASREEGFGLPTLEAMACRTPVIATPAGAAPELLSNGGGILLNDYAASSMAQAIQSFFALDESQWRQMSETAYKQARQRSWEDAIHQFEAALSQIIAADSI